MSNNTNIKDLQEALNPAMSKEVAQLTLRFLQRVDLKGSEAETLHLIQVQLVAIIEGKKL